MLIAHRPMTLIVLDGWGYREDTHSNAIVSANIPFWQQLWQNYPHTLLAASGTDVGLPPGQIGNSEVGHLHMGAGRLVPQDLRRIDISIENGDFFKNPTLTHAVEQAIKTDKAIHIFGLLSRGGVHSHERHIIPMVELAARHGAKKVYVHAFLDGRDVPPKSAMSSLAKMEEKLHTLGCGRIATIIGRYYAMDRDQRWERTQQAYDLLTLGKANYHAPNARSGLQMAYERNETDEFVKPTVIGDPAITVNDGDVVIFMNFRADRVRQLTRAFIDPNFQGFTRSKRPHLAAYVSLTEYSADLKTQVAYSLQSLTNVFGEYLARLGYKQLRIAETEKYAHVTYFFNGGREEVFPGEDRILVSSPKVATYDLQPEMSATELTDRLVTAIRSKQYDAIICNYANPDMVGHTGDFKATVKAVETIDTCLKRVIEALHEVGGETIITSDHGNAELMFNTDNNQPHTAHTELPVPCLYVGRKAVPTTSLGRLYDIAPTLLHLMNLPVPTEMTGQNLFQLVE
ncbi:MAG: 2,3-bisphosphoglycerate-independent phosphoglycerate mutase [Gammaproteobacteria bacterium]